MNKKLLSIISGILAMPALVFAQIQTYGPSYGIVSIVHGAEMTAGLVFGAIAVIAFLMAGILFLTAQGEPEKLKAAKSAFIWGVAGVVVGIIAFSIIAIVGSMLR